MPLQANFNRVKEPRGFIKILEFFIAILAFSTTAGYNSKPTASIPYYCGNVAHNQLIKYEFGYSFSKNTTNIGGTECVNNTLSKQSTESDLPSEIKHSSEFFVFVGVVSFLYCIVAMVYYICFEDPAKYGPSGTGRDIKSFATVDFGVSILLTLFWFCGSAAWAAGLTKLKDKTDVDYCKGIIAILPDVKCNVTEKANYAGLTISVLFGFLCCFLWAANVWFAFKETVWHNEPGAAINTTEKPESSEIPHQEVPGETVP